jgi:hypothetical protein
MSDPARRDNTNPNPNESPKSPQADEQNDSDVFGELLEDAARIGEAIAGTAGLTIVGSGLAAGWHQVKGEGLAEIARKEWEHVDRLTEAGAEEALPKAVATAKETTRALGAEVASRDAARVVASEASGVLTTVGAVGVAVVGSAIAIDYLDNKTGGKSTDVLYAVGEGISDGVGALLDAPGAIVQGVKSAYHELHPDHPTPRPAWEHVGPNYDAPADDAQPDYDAPGDVPH